MRPVTLAGAYHPHGRPLEQRRLIVELTLPLAFAAVELPVSGTIDAEELATGAPAEGVVRLEEKPPAIRAELSFRGDDGHDYVLSFGSEVTRFDIRALTELAGEMSRVPGALVGPVRLRVDWRTALFGSA